MTDSLNYESQPDVVDVAVDKSYGSLDERTPKADKGVLHSFELILKSHLVLAALLFPTAWIDSSSQSSRSNTYRIWCLTLAGFLLILHIFGTIMLVTRSQWIDFAKALFVVVSWLLSLQVLIVVNHRIGILRVLYAIEEEASQTRDESVMLIRTAQAGISSLNKQVYGDAGSGQFVTASELIKSIGPLALMFLNKEKSILKWGTVGVNLVVKGVKLAKGLLKTK